MPVREIVCPKVSGVYMLGELKHRYNRRSESWSCGFSYYIGQSEDVAQRFVAHRSPKSKLNLCDCRMLLLSEVPLRAAQRSRLELLERKFINAALEMKLPLRNTQLVREWWPDLEEEKTILTEAIATFRELAATEWKKHTGICSGINTVAA